MGNFETIKSDKEAKNEKIEEWKAKLSELIANERLKEEQGQKFNPHLLEIKVEFLKDEDIKNFGNFIEQTLSKQAHQKYLEENDFFAATKNEEESSRGALSGYVANQILKPKNQKWYDPENYQAMLESGSTEKYRQQESAQN